MDDLNVADGDEGTDRLKHIEVLQFGDYTLNLEDANAALVRVADQTGIEDVPHDFFVDAFDFDGGTVSVESVSVTGGGRMTAQRPGTNMSSSPGPGRCPGRRSRPTCPRCRTIQ